MRIISKSPLIEFYKQHANAKTDVEAWWYEAKHAVWKTPLDIKARYVDASIVGDNRVVFNICSNHYRLVVKFHYNTGVGYIRFIGTHREYNKIDVEVI